MAVTYPTISNLIIEYVKIYRNFISKSKRN